MNELERQKRENGVLEMLLADENYLNAEKLDDRRYRIHLSNGKTILAEQKAEWEGSIWAWSIDGQFFDNEIYARRYLETRITELLTGKRVLFHYRHEVPEICGINGAACRAPGECNRALCNRCPVAEQYFAESEGLELIYAVEE